MLALNQLHGGFFKTDGDRRVAFVHAFGGAHIKRHTLPARVVDKQFQCRIGLGNAG